jgi:hypothetical protein
MNKWNNKFRYQVASCWLFILNYTAHKRKLESLKLCKQSYNITCIQIKGVDSLYAKLVSFIYTKQTVLHTCFWLFARELLRKPLVYVRTALAAFFSKIPSSMCSVFFSKIPSSMCSVFFSKIPSSMCSVFFSKIPSSMCSVFRQAVECVCVT